jgi:acetate kinase
MRLLILNAGSSNLKYSVIDAVDERLWLQDQTAGQQSIRTIVGDIRSRWVGAGGDIEGVVHRVVHGGTRFTHARAALAIAIFVHRTRQAVGVSAVTLGGVDALVFIGGIGEHSAEIRAAICDGLFCLGLDIDLAANAAARPDALVSRRESRSAVLVIAAREDLMMARAARALAG